MADEYLLGGPDNLNYLSPVGAAASNATLNNNALTNAENNYQSLLNSPLTSAVNSIATAAAQIFPNSWIPSNSGTGLPGTTNSISTAGTGGIAGSTSTNTALLSDLFLRSVIIILGFIFVAVGLSMFKGS